MSTIEKQPISRLAPLTFAWAGLVALTLLSVVAGQWFDGGLWLQLFVAGTVWLKGLLVARRFIEVELAHPFIRRVVLVFVAFAPLALIGIAFFGDPFARWATL